MHSLFLVAFDWIGFVRAGFALVPVSTRRWADQDQDRVVAAAAVAVVVVGGGGDCDCDLPGSVANKIDTNGLKWSLFRLHTSTQFYSE